MTPHEAFQKVFKGQRNIMTPNVIACEQRGKHYVELSTGEGIQHGTQIYGVTVIMRETLEHAQDLSKCFHSLHEASQYMDSLA